MSDEQIAALLAAMTDIHARQLVLLTQIAVSLERIDAVIGPMFRSLRRCTQCGAAFLHKNAQAQYCSRRCNVRACRARKQKRPA
jgi:hypothetical protein